jgi:hypothetical protein
VGVGVRDVDLLLLQQLLLLLLARLTCFLPYAVAEDLPGLLYALRSTLKRPTLLCIRPVCIAGGVQNPELLT